jgi:hypothetical protein
MNPDAKRIGLTSLSPPAPSSASAGVRETDTCVRGAPAELIKPRDLDGTPPPVGGLAWPHRFH